MTRKYVPFLVLIVLGIWGCDSTPSDPGSSEFELVGGAYATDNDAYVPVGISECFFTPEPSEQARRLNSGRLSLYPDGDFGLTFVGQLFPYESTSPETLHVVGSYERYGSLLQLSPNGLPIWYATVGPDPRSPSTLVLADYSPAGTNDLLGSGRCRQLVFSIPDMEPDWIVKGGAEAAAFDLVHIYFSNASFDLPYTFGRQGEIRYDSARVDLQDSGTYQFNLWYVSGGIPQVISVAGAFVKEGPLYAFDPGIARMAFAVVEGDSLILYRNYWTLLLGQQGDLLLHRR